MTCFVLLSRWIRMRLMLFLIQVQVQVMLKLQQSRPLTPALSPICKWPASVVVKWSTDYQLTVIFMSSATCCNFISEIVCAAASYAVGLWATFCLILVSKCCCAAFQLPYLYVFCSCNLCLRNDVMYLDFQKAFCKIYPTWLTWKDIW